MAPGRVSASLERMTAGYDPERRIVTDAGGEWPRCSTACISE